MQNTLNIDNLKLDNFLSIGEDNSFLPFSIEAEQALLGAILLDYKCLNTVADIVPTSEYFYIENHKAIYSVMTEMYALSIPIDFITVLEQLKLHNYSDSIENIKTYLLKLAQIVPSVSSVQKYAEIIREKYRIRKLVCAAKEIIEESSDGTNEASLLLDSAEQKIFDIRQGNEVRGLIKLNESIIKTFDRLDQLNSADRDLYKSISTGIEDLDRTITGLNRSDLILLAARPGMGKTSFALNIARNVSLKSKKRVAFFSLEMTREQLTSRLLSSEANVQSTKLKTGILADDDWARLIEAGDTLSKIELYLDDTPGITVQQMKAKLRRLKSVDLVLVDYLQLMSSAKRIDNRVQEVSDITRNLKHMAKELDVPVLVLSQLSRASEQRTEHRPMLSDLRDSGSIEQDADIVLFLYREDYYNSTNEIIDEDVNKNSGECIVAKNRHGETRTVPLYWEGEYMRFTGTDNTERDTPF